MPEFNLGTARGKIEVDYDGKGVDKAKRDFGGVEESSKKTSRAFKESGDAAGVAGAGIAIGLGLAAKVAIDFEKQVSAIGAVSGASAADLERLRKKALQLGSDTSFGATEAALAMEELAKAGLSTEAILNGAADATVALAAAGGVALPEAAELAADAMTSFGLSASDMPKIADQIAGAANASSIGVSQFGQSLKQVGAVANLTGISFKDTATAIALMGANGIKGSDAGTSLKTMLSNLVPSTAKARDVMKELGIITKEGGNSFIDAQGNMKPLAEISEILQSSTSKLTASQKMLALETIFGSDAIRAAAILTKSGAEGFDKMAESMGKVTAEQVAAARLNNTAGQIEQLKGAAETAAISIGTLLLPALTKIAKVLTSAAQWFNGLSEGTKNTVTNVALATAAFLLLYATVIRIIAVAKAISTFVAAVRALSLATKAAAVASKIAAAAQMLWNAAMALNPVGLIIIAIIAIIAGLVLLWNKSAAFRDFWIAIWEWIKKAAQSVADWFMGTFVPFLKEAWDNLVKIWQLGFDIIRGVIDAGIAYFNFWKSVIGAVLSWIGNYFKQRWDLVVSIVKGAINFVMSSINWWKAQILAAIRVVGGHIDKIQAFFSAMKAKVVAHISSFVSTVKGVPGRVLAALGNFKNLLVNKGRDLVQGLIDGLRSKLAALRSAAAAMIGPVARFLPGSPAEEGPLSGRGYVMYRGQHLVEDFATGILGSARLAKDAMASVIGNAANDMPVNYSSGVAAATTGMGSITLAPAVTASSGGDSTSSSRTISIGNLNLTGVWDFNDSGVPRRIVTELHAALERYEKEYR